MASAHRRPARSELAQKIQDRWIELSAEDIDYIDVYRDRLIERLAERYRMTLAQAATQVGKWERKLVLPVHCDRLKPGEKISRQSAKPTKEMHRQRAKQDQPAASKTSLATLQSAVQK